MMQKENIIPFLWILLGLFLDFTGLKCYWDYSNTGVLWLFVIPTYSAIFDIILGVCCITLGLTLLKRSNISIGLTLLIFLLIPSMTIGIFLWEYFKFGNSFNWSARLFDYFIYILLVLTFRFLKKNNMIEKSKDVWKYIFRTQAFILFGCLTLVTITFILSKVIPYELFSH
ncbi:hypothetical protein DSECCO2_574510 [anaerobic digester metagenome]